MGSYVNLISDLVSKVERGDEAALKQLEQLQDEGVIDEVAKEDPHILERVNSALDSFGREKAEQEARQEVGQEVREEAEQEARERRQKIAGILRQKGQEEAALAVSMDLEGKDVKTLLWVSQTIEKAVEVAGLYGWAKLWSYRHANHAKWLAKKLIPAETEKIFFRFLAGIQRAVALIDRHRQVPKGAHPELLRAAQKALEEARHIFWAPWNLNFLEKEIEKIDGKGPMGPIASAISPLLQENAELALAVGSTPKGRKATVLRKGLISQAEERISWLREKIETRRGLKREKRKKQDN